jgi:putative (di)nucleoside polyphosphate hydrolase
MVFPSLEEINEIRKTGFRPQVVGCFLCDKKILFLYSKKHNLWQFPQGGIENGETLNQAIIREMKEELGDEFLEGIEPGVLVGEDIIEFTDSHKNLRELKIDNGQEIYMKGKKYFFIAIKAKADKLDIAESEFDDYKWLGYKESSELAAAIYQPGKRRIMKKIIKSLFESGLLA